MQLRNYEFLLDTPYFDGPTHAFRRWTVEEAKTLLQAVQNSVPEVAASLLQTMDEAQALKELPQTALILAATESGDSNVFTMILDAMLEKMPLRQVGESPGAQSHGCIGATSSNKTGQT